LVICGVRDCEALKDTIINRIGKHNTSTVQPDEAAGDNKLLAEILTEVSAIRRKLEG